MKNNTENLIDEIFDEPEIKHCLNVFTILIARFSNTKTVISRPGPNVLLSMCKYKLIQSIQYILSKKMRFR